MPGGYQFSAPAALYPVSAAASGHPGGAGAGNAATQYGKAGPMGGGATGSSSGGAQSGQTQSGGGGAGGGGQSNAGGAASGYASYGSTYDEFSKSVYGSVSAGGQATKIGGSGSAGAGGPSGVGGGASGSADLGPNVYGKTHNQLSKINVRSPVLSNFVYLIIFILLILLCRRTTKLEDFIRERHRRTVLRAMRA